MSWAVGWDTTWQRDVGYGVPATCDQPGCDVAIDRGLAYVCGGEPFGGQYGCGLYFCPQHTDGCATVWGSLIECDHFFKDDPTYRPSPDTREWVEHKLTDPSWGFWREGHPHEVERLRKELAA